jgi:hypothetical protein
LRHSHNWLVLVKECGCGPLGRLNPLESYERAPLSKVYIDLLDLAILRKEMIEGTQLIQLLRHIIHDYAESLLFFHGHRRLELYTLTTGVTPC